MSGAEPGQGVAFTYSDGDVCSSGGKAKSTINLVCNSAAVPGYIYEAVQNSCDYTLSGYSADACGEEIAYGGSDGLGAGSIILIM